MPDSLNVAVVGVGQWGSNVLRALTTVPRCRVRYLCDSDSTILASQAERYPHITRQADFQAVLADPEVNAVVIATGGSKHYHLASRALAAGKDVFVEKPMTVRSSEARALVSEASSAGRRLMVGHLLQYHPAFETIRAMVAAGEVGDIYYMYTQRLNLGIIRRDENAWWYLAPHDISIICRLFEAEPVSVSAQGQGYLRPADSPAKAATRPRSTPDADEHRGRAIEDIVFATLKFADGRMAGIHVSWLDPRKIRQMTIVGTKKMITWDDMSASEKVRVYDKSATVPPFAGYAEAITLRTGDIVIPRVESTEPLVREMQHFIDACLDNRPILTDGADGLRVVRVLEAGQRSLETGGAPVSLDAD